MNKEINTIIANLDDCIGMFDYLLTPTESKLLVSYIAELQQENKQLKDNWNKLKEYLSKKEKLTFNSWNTGIHEIQRKMQELEKGE